VGAGVEDPRPPEQRRVERPARAPAAPPGGVEDEARVGRREPRHEARRRPGNLNFLHLVALRGERGPDPRHRLDRVELGLLLARRQPQVVGECNLHGAPPRSGSMEHGSGVRHFNLDARARVAVAMNRLVLVGPLGARAAAAPPPTLDAPIRRTGSDGKIAPAPPADDGTFLRRISLDLTGKLPSRQAAAVYIGDPDP